MGKDVNKLSLRSTLDVVTSILKDPLKMDW
jgi:hypothetical protein